MYTKQDDDYARGQMRFDGFDPYNSVEKLDRELHSAHYIRWRAELGPLNEYDANGQIVGGGL